MFFSQGQEKSWFTVFGLEVYIGMVFRFVFENKQTNVFLEQTVSQQHFLFSSKTKNIVPFFFNPKQMFFFFFVKLPEAILDIAIHLFLGTFVDKVPTFVHVKNSLPENENT